MKCITRIEFLIAVPLWLASGSMTSAMAGNAPLVSPGHLLRSTTPAIKVMPRQTRQAIARPASKVPLSSAQTAPVVIRSGKPAGLSSPRASLLTHTTKPAIAVAPAIRATRPSSHRPAPRLQVPGFSSPLSGNQAANKARAIEGGTRMRQLRQLKHMRDLGSPIDRVSRGRNVKGRKDCSLSSNRAECLRNNMAHPGQNPGLPNGVNRRRMQDCLNAGGNPASCMQSGRGRGKGPAGAGRIGAGPGSPTDGVNIPGRGQAKQDGGTSHGRFQGWNVRGGHPNRDGSTTNTRSGTYQDGTVVKETVTVDGDGNVVSRTHTERTQNGRVLNSSESNTFNWRDGSTTTFHHENEGRSDESHSVMSIGRIRVTPGSPDNQPAPEGSNGPANDNCDYVPGQGCRKKQADTRGMTSQPGPNGQNSGARTGGFVPHIGSAVATDCGDASSDACNRGGFGLRSGGTRLDMKDPGHGVPAGAVPK